MGLTDKKLLHVKQIYKNRILVQGTIVTGKYYENIYYITEKKNPKPKQTNKQNLCLECPAGAAKARETGCI